MVVCLYKLATWWTGHLALSQSWTDSCFSEGVKIIITSVNINTTKGWKDNILRGEKNNTGSSHTDIKNDLFSLRAIQIVDDIGYPRHLSPPYSKWFIYRNMDHNLRGNTNLRITRENMCISLCGLKMLSSLDGEFDNKLFSGDIRIRKDQLSDWSFYVRDISWTFVTPITLIRICITIIIINCHKRLGYLSYAQNKIFSCLLVALGCTKNYICVYLHINYSGL